jgi:hypothetical protein
MSEKIYKTINNERIELTAEEIAELETKKTEGLALAQAIQADIQAKEKQKATDKANGNQKLLDLGLSQAEATALTGYTPPVAE